MGAYLQEALNRMGSKSCPNRREKIIWECENGGQHWGDPAELNYTPSRLPFPSGICGPGWQSLFTAFVVSILVDLAFQVCLKRSQVHVIKTLHYQMYMFFLNWRFMKRLQRYSSLKGPYGKCLSPVSLPSPPVIISRGLGAYYMLLSQSNHAFCNSVPVSEEAIQEICVLGACT